MDVDERIRQYGRGVYGTLGVPAAANVPGAREEAMGWADSSGNLWLFGGWGYDSAKTFGILNDFWKFNPTTKQWSWMRGSSTVPNANDTCQPGIYGTQGVASTANVPGGDGPPAVGLTVAAISGSLAAKASTPSALAAISTISGSSTPPRTNGLG
jgi:hypothetical protein